MRAVAPVRVAVAGAALLSLAAPVRAAEAVQCSDPGSDFSRRVADMTLNEGQYTVVRRACGFDLTADAAYYAEIAADHGCEDSAFARDMEALTGPGPLPIGVQAVIDATSARGAGDPEFAAVCAGMAACPFPEGYAELETRYDRDTDPCAQALGAFQMWTIRR